MRNKNCHQCGHALHGRADKKFCDAYCRAQYHNQRLKSDNDQIKSLDRNLKHNYRILSRLKGREAVVLPKTVLERLGFQFGYCTQHFTNAKGSRFEVCYDCAISNLDDTRVAIIPPEKIS